MECTICGASARGWVHVHVHVHEHVHGHVRVHVHMHMHVHVLVQVRVKRRCEAGGVSARRLVERVDKPWCLSKHTSRARPDGRLAACICICIMLYLECHRVT